MAIAFECVCGKKMSAKEEFGGRRLRCPDCQSVLTIPVAGTTPPSARPATRPQSAPQAAATLTRDELFALGIGRSPHDAPPAPTAVPVATPLAQPKLTPLAAPVGQTPAVAKAVHPWVDQSLQQVTTPWRPGDEERYQAGIAAALEWEWPLGWIALALGVVGLIGWTTVMG